MCSLSVQSTLGKDNLTTTNKGRDVNQADEDRLDFFFEIDLWAGPDKAKKKCTLYSRETCHQMSNNGDVNGGGQANGNQDSGGRRRSRWGDRSEGDGDGEGVRKRSRWGGKDETPVVAGLSAGAALLVQQNPELIKIQIRLNEIQRLQALPRFGWTADFFLQHLT